jgi:hypothetical protein
LDVGLDGAGGAFQVVGNRWPDLGDTGMCRTLYELTYSVRTAPAPWESTRIVTFQSRYTLRNDGHCRPVRVAQAGVEARAFELPPGHGQAFHWPDFQRPALVVVSLVDAEDVFGWSGPVDISSITDIPLVIRGKPPGGSGGWELVDADQVGVCPLPTAAGQSSHCFKCGYHHVRLWTAWVVLACRPCRLRKPRRRAV